MKIFVFLMKLYQKEKWFLLLGMLLGFLTLLAGLGLLSLSGWLIAASAVAGLSSSTALLFNYLLPAAGVRFFSLLRILGRYGERVVTHEATFRTLTDLRVWVYQKLERLSPLQWMAYQNGQMLHYLVHDVDVLNQVYLRILMPVLLAILLCFSLWVYLCFFNGYVASIIFISLLAILIALPILAYQLGHRLSVVLYESKQQLQVAWLEVLQGIKELQIFNGVNQKMSEMMSLNKKLMRCDQRMAKVKGYLIGILSLASGALIVFILYAESKIVILGHLSGPVVVLTMFAIMAVYEIIFPIPFVFQFLNKTLISARRLYDLTATVPDVYFLPASREAPSDSGVVFENISFYYSASSSREILKNFSLEIRSGEKIGLYGPSGCGKSTLVHLLTRSANPQKGNIYVGGANIRLLSEPNLRQQMSVLSQHPYIFSASIRENILLGKPTASDDEIWDVIRQVGLGENFERLSQGLDTWIGEQGSRLSGGQCRRLALARIILQDAPLWILDEPTEGLDSKSRTMLLKTLSKLWGSKTVILISHRMQDLEGMTHVHLMET